MRHLVIGAGEVGTALASVLDCDVRDIDPHDGEYDMIHITFPYFDGFEDAVMGYTEQHNPMVVVVHSTVPTGTCDKHGWTHSPIRGRHPHLAEGIETFVKHIGGTNGRVVAREFYRAGMTVKIHDLAATTEAGKLWELAQFGIEVAMNKRIAEWCDRHGVPFDEVYGEFSRTYNAGWGRLKEHRFHKPILTYDPRPIGGHCVIENAPMLEEAWVDEILAPYADREGAPAGGQV